MACDRPVAIRNLSSLQQDLVDEAREGLRLLRGPRPLDDATAVRVEMKLKNIVEFLTGYRD